MPLGARRIALISDIHGNLVALDAVLADIEQRDVHEIICLGDVALLGPDPRGVLARLRDLGCLVVMGNADHWLLEPYEEDEQTGSAHYQQAGQAADEARRMRDVGWWSMEQLSPEDVAYMRGFPPTVAKPLGTDAVLLCCHGSPRAFTDIIMSTTPPSEIDEMVADAEATVIAGGHTHVQMIRRHRKMSLINPGSVGLPYDQNPWSGEVARSEVRLAPWGEYAIVEWDRGRLDIRLRRVPLDTQAVARAAFATGRPHAEWWARSWGVAAYLLCLSATLLAP